MPVILGPFETSLRGGDSPSVDRKLLLHKGCCGNLHGHGVKKEKSVKEVPPTFGRSCSHENNGGCAGGCHLLSSSSDESFPPNANLSQSMCRVGVCASSNHGGHRVKKQPPRSLSSDSGGRHLLSSSSSLVQQHHRRVSSRSSSCSNSAIAQRLYSSLTKATTAKIKVERTASDGPHLSLKEAKRFSRPEDPDSGHFSSEAEVDNSMVDFTHGLIPRPEDRRLSLIHGMSEDDLSSSSYVKNPSCNNPSIIISLSASKQQKKCNNVRSSMRYGQRRCDDSDSSSVSPPASPSPTNATKFWKSNCHRTLITGFGNNRRTSPKKANDWNRNYAFGSSTQRFSNYTSHHDGVGSNGSLDLFHDETKRQRVVVVPTRFVSHNYPISFSRSNSDENTRRQQQQQHRTNSLNATQEAWHFFKNDVETAMEKKPHSHGFYKNLSDMMQSKMEMLEQAKSEEELASEKAFLEAERVWLVHRDGFVGAGLLENDSKNPPPEGKVRVQLDYNGDIIEVDEDDVEKANPLSFDKIEDLAQLRFLNESSILQTLRQRYASKLTHTFAGPSIISVNPMAPLAIYSDNVIKMFKECKPEDVPPHIYSVAQSAHRSLVHTRRDQSIVFIGRSGSGKSTNVRHVMNYFAVATSSSVLSSEKVSAMFCLLEAFGNARTILNADATRYSCVVSVDFDTTSGVVNSASLQTVMLEKTRVVRRPEGEPNFNIFYQMLAGLDDKTRRDLHLENLNEPNLFMTPLQGTEDKTKATVTWGKIIAYTQVLVIHPNEALSLWAVIAAIYHLGVASVSNRGGKCAQFARPQAAHRAALCLGTSLEDLSTAIFHRSNKVKSETTSSYMESLEGFVVGLYQEAFNALVYLINRSLASPTTSCTHSILILDTPGFQNPSSGNRRRGANFVDLCHNYMQERLQLLFHDRSISSPRDSYLREQLELDGLVLEAEDGETPAPLVSLVDKPTGVRTPGGDAESVERRGLLWLLDEESIFPGSSDESFVERLLLQQQHPKREVLLSKGPGEQHFVLHHQQGSNPVLYSAEGWLRASRENTAIVKAATNLLQESNLKHMSELYNTTIRTGSSSLSGSVAGLEGSPALRRVSSMRRVFTSGTGASSGIKRNSVALQMKFQTDVVCEQLRRTKIHFVHCFLPQHEAGLCQVQANLATEDLNVPLVRSQIRGAQILDVVRLHKNGFPESVSFGEFWRKYKVLSDDEDTLHKHQPAMDEIRSAISNLLEELDLDKTAVRLGNTQVFLRSGVLAHLNEERDEKLTDQVIKFQAICRGYLTRRKFHKLKTHDIAIRCIQKNVRKFVGVRDWPWWRLLIKITPMLNVHRTENMLKTKTEELDTLKNRLEKAEKERSELKQANERLESRLSEMTADLGEEQSAATLAAERLEAEQSERMRLEKDKGQLQSLNRQLVSASEKMERELLLSRAISMNGSVVDEEDEHNQQHHYENNVFKQKYDRAMQELDFTKKRLQQQHEDDLEQLLALKKQLEKKLNDAYEEVDEQRQLVAQWKRKTQKVQGEMTDMKVLLDERASRNLLLEKKQRKFDVEMNALQEDIKRESTTKDKLQRDVDQIKSQKFQLEDQLHALKLDLDYKESKISSLNKELEDLQAGGASEEEVASLKKQKHDLEMRLKDQEDELDDLAGQVQMLEQSKIKLEMSMAAMKKEHRRELSGKDDELEDVRASCQKKVKVMEQQLECEHEERINFMREKHDLESKIFNLQELATRSATDEDHVGKLKRDLKRTKALLKDAQLMIEKGRNETSNKVVLRQLKNQLEDAEFARMAAVKAKQNTELEVSDLQQQLDDVIRNKSELEDRMIRVSREKSELSGQLDDNEEELQEVMKKYKATVSQLSVDQITLQEQANSITDLEEDRNRLKEQIAEMSQKIESLEGETVGQVQQHRLELKIKELESKLELEQTTRSRMETQIVRLKEAVEKLNGECDVLRSKESTSQDHSRRLQRQLRDLKEDYAGLQVKETETNAKKNELEKKLELAEAETVTARNDLKLAFKRIEDLQTAINGELDSDSINSDVDSDSSDEGLETFLDHHRRACSVQRERESMGRETSIQRGVSRQQLPTMPEESETIGASSPSSRKSDNDQRVV